MHCVNVKFCLQNRAVIKTGETYRLLGLTAAVKSIVPFVTFTGLYAALANKTNDSTRYVSEEDINKSQGLVGNGSASQFSSSNAESNASIASEARPNSFAKE